MERVCEILRGWKTRGGVQSTACEQQCLSTHAIKYDKNGWVRENPRGSFLVRDFHAICLEPKKSRVQRLPPKNRSRGAWVPKSDLPIFKTIKYPFPRQATCAQRQAGSTSPHPIHHMYNQQRVHSITTGVTAKREAKRYQTCYTRRMSQRPWAG